MKRHIELDGENYALEWRANGAQSEYTLTGAETASGSASIREVMPGVFSILLGPRSFTVHVAWNGEQLEVWTGSNRHDVSVADTRDRLARSGSASPTGPVEVRAQMPGRVVKVLVELGAPVEAGQGVIVVEAMKMQNEMKASKSGKVAKINVTEGAAVAAGQSLIVIE